MSDERDSADAAADGTEDSGSVSRGQTAVVTPQRPTGKRTRQRLAAGDDEDSTDTEVIAVEDGAGKNGSGSKGKGGRKAAKGSDGPSRNPILFVINYLKQVVAELRKVIWPNRKQMVSYTSVVLVFLVFMVALISGVDLGWGRLVLLVFG
ncbi:preprotein translocase subunit SecE [Mycolicibacterium komossense]|uniref:Protein translocase subunit SecE n=1 Tax=Mycolicibacterium komossense TaxID=1779 RepID=A0ABT3CE82_9MYCO|nr:preprotein translocase subunit SecE [Mycolicibacterium komossense]MCV7227536.1 preprotein translocase subunit SecE [Mycolicibacterium komossense]